MSSDALAYPLKIKGGREMITGYWYSAVVHLLGLIAVILAAVLLVEFEKESASEKKAKRRIGIVLFFIIAMIVAYRMAFGDETATLGKAVPLKQIKENVVYTVVEKLNADLVIIKEDSEDSKVNSTENRIVAGLPQNLAKDAKFIIRSENVFIPITRIDQ